jgi:hypothetical protein
MNGSPTTPIITVLTEISFGRLQFVNPASILMLKTLIMEDYSSLLPEHGKQPEML